MEVDAAFCVFWKKFHRNIRCPFGNVSFVQIPVAKVLHMVPNSWAAVLCFEFPLIIVVSYFLTLLLVKYFPMYIGKKELWRTA